MKNKIIDSSGISLYFSHINGLFASAMIKTQTLFRPSTFMLADIDSYWHRRFPEDSNFSS